MIITCSKCSTSFNLDDALIRKDGSKVRCSICKNIFTAYPEDAAAKTDGQPSNQGESAFEQPSAFDMDEGDFSLPDDDLEIETDDLLIPDPGTPSGSLDTEPKQKDDGFSFEETDFDMDLGLSSTQQKSDIEFEDDDILDGIDFEPLKEDDDDLILSMEEDDPDLKTEKPEDHSFSDTSEQGATDGDTAREDDEFDLTLSMDDDEDNIQLDEIESELSTLEMGVASESSESGREEPEELSLSEEELSLSKSDEEDLPVISPDDDFSNYEAALSQETEPEEGNGDDEEEDEEEETEKRIAQEEINLIAKSPPLMGLEPAFTRKKKKSGSRMPLLILLFLLLVVIGLYVAGLMTGTRIPYLSDVRIPILDQYIKKPTPEVRELKPLPNEKSVNGRFVSNTKAGTLFVITGRVDNPSNASCSFIEVRGTLSTKDLPEAKVKNAFCGNIITEEMLKTGDIAEINRLLDMREGAHNANVDILPGASVPFMIVFSDLPEKLQNFNIKVVSFEKSEAKPKK